MQDNTFTFIYLKLLCIGDSISSAKKSAIKMRSNVHVKIALHFLKCGVTLTICRGNFYCRKFYECLMIEILIFNCHAQAQMYCFSLLYIIVIFTVIVRAPILSSLKANERQTRLSSC